MAILITDPVVFARTITGDLEFPLRLLAGLEAAAVGVRTRMLLFSGEWFLNLDAGVPYLPDDGGVTETEAILGQKFDAIKTRAALRREILTTPGVVSIPTLTVGFDSSTRRLSITWVVRTLWGDTPVDTLDRSI